MNTKLNSMIVGLISVLNGLAQGSFQNLNFEEATVPLNPPTGNAGFYPVSTVLPGWNVYYAGVVQSQITYNAPVFTTPSVTLLNNAAFPLTPLNGNFGLYMYSFVSDAQIPIETRIVSIGQTGLVSALTRSLRLKLAGSTPLREGQMFLSFNGTFTSLQPILTNNFYYVGADFSPFAGQAGELQIGVVPQVGMSAFYFIDDIEFSPDPVPEPSMVALLALAGAALLWHLRHRVS